MAEQSSISVIDNAPINTIRMPSLPTLAEIESITAICRIAAQSNFVNSSAPMNNQTQRMADAFFVVMMGRELGISAMMALKTIFVIDGKPSCSGQALLSLMRRAGVEVILPDPASITDSATIRVKRPGGEWHEYTYTEEMAKLAGLLNRGTWQKYKREMLLWRCVSMTNRFETPDITGGMYTIEEIAPPNLEVNAEGDIVGQLSLAASTPSSDIEKLPAQKAPPAQSNLIDGTEDATKGWATEDSVKNLIGYCIEKLGVTAKDISRYTGIQNLHDVPVWATKYGERATAALAIKAGAEADAEALKNLPPATTKAETTKWTKTSLKKAVLSDVYGGNDFHCEASLKKLIEAGKLPPVLTLAQAIEVVKNRKAEEQPKDASQEAFDKLPSEFEKEPPVPAGDVPF